MESDGKVVYWHREMPPLEADAVGEHTLEANSGRVQGTLAHGDELWCRCYEELMNEVGSRLKQEVERLGGDYAHVLSESVESKHDAISGERWLHGLLTYVLYRRPQRDPAGYAKA